MTDNDRYVAKKGKYKQNPTDQDRIFEAMWAKTHKYLSYGLTRDQMIQIEKEGYIMPEEIKNNKHPELICLFCEKKDFTEKKIPFPTEKGIIMSEAFVCNQCGEPLMNSEQMDNFIKLSKNDL